ncbi:hypothetical protein J6590_095470, partial [Homalodisca vitripennis]
MLQFLDDEQQTYQIRMNNSPSARWGLRPQAPIWVLAKFGDKRSSNEASWNGSPAIGLQRKACKGKTGVSSRIFLKGSEVKNSGFQTFPGGLKIPATCVRNLVFPALLEVVYTMKRPCNSKRNKCWFLFPELRQEPYYRKSAHR